MRSCKNGGAYVTDQLETTDGCRTRVGRLRRGRLSDKCLLAAQGEQHCRDRAHVWRDRMFTPPVTLRLFLLQVLGGNTSVTRARQLAKAVKDL